MTDTAKNSAAAEEGVYETPEDIAAEAAKPAERAARTDADSPIAPVDPFEPGSLGWLLPWAETGEGDVLTPDEALEVFLEWVDARGMELWPHQEDALMDLAVGDSVILGTPTGSGKSMVALGLCFMAVATGRTAYYTAPIKALVSEKFFDMVDILGRENVGMTTGDSTINTEAPVICCTAEILANQALREGPASKVACVVMDEFHFYADPDRGWAWQVPLLTLPNAQFLLMSATLGDVSDIAAALEERTGRPVDLVTDAPRPVPLSYDYTFETLEATVELGLRAGEAPMYIVHFSQDEALKNARALASYGVSDKAQREEIKQAMKGTKFTTPFGKILQRLLAAGEKAVAKVKAEAEKEDGISTFIFGWAPTVDGDVLPAQPFDPQAPAQSKDVPVMIGTTLHEFTMSTYVPAFRTITKEKAVEFLKQRYGDRTDDFLTAFEKAYPGYRPKDLVDVDFVFRPGAVEQARLKAAQQGAPVYMYMFAWESPVLDGMFRSTHCMEIPFAFNNAVAHASMTGGGAEAQALAEKMSGAWLNFARTGNPNAEGLPQWDAYTEEGGATMFFNNRCEVKHHHDKELLEVVRAFPTRGF